MLIRHRTLIYCAVPRVWQATIDIDTWPAWAPTVQSARRLDKLRFGIGSQARIKQPLQASTIWTVTAFEDGKLFAWETADRLFRMRAIHNIVSRPGGTESTLSVEPIGPVAQFFGFFMAPLLWTALSRENRGLKHWCEAEFWAIEATRGTGN